MLKLFLAKLLKLINPKKPLGGILFNAIARVSVTTACEAVILRKNELGETEVFLTKRENHEAYAGQEHCPGSVVRPYENIEHVFERIGKNEIGARITKRIFMGVISNKIEKRGHFLQLIFKAELSNEPQYGRWYTIENLPSNIISFHKTHTIPIAMGVYKGEGYSDIGQFIIEL